LVFLKFSNTAPNIMRRVPRVINKVRFSFKNITESVVEIKGEAAMNGTVNITPIFLSAT